MTTQKLHQTTKETQPQEKACQGLRSIMTKCCSRPKGHKSQAYKNIWNPHKPNKLCIVWQRTKYVLSSQLLITWIANKFMNKQEKKEKLRRHWP